MPQAPSNSSPYWSIGQLVVEAGGARSLGTAFAVSKRVILTAAHVLNKRSPTARFTIGGTEIPVLYFKLHPKYKDPFPTVHDIAAAYLERDIATFRAIPLKYDLPRAPTGKLSFAGYSSQRSRIWYEEAAIDSWTPGRGGPFVYPADTTHVSMSGGPVASGAGTTRCQVVGIISGETEIGDARETRGVSAPLSIPANKSFVQDRIRATSALEWD